MVPRQAAVYSQIAPLCVHMSSLIALSHRGSRRRLTRSPLRSANKDIGDWVYVVPLTVHSTVASNLEFTVVTVPIILRQCDNFLRTVIPLMIEKALMARKPLATSSSTHEYCSTGVDNISIMTSYRYTDAEKFDILPLV